MSEDEIVKHTKKLYKIWFSGEHTIWHKLGEFLLEIIIIVFAVSISIWFHNLSEHKQQQKEVKAFLIGLKSDLTDDIKEMNGDKNSYINQKILFSYIAGLKINELPSRDTLNKYGEYFNNTTEFNPNDGRFQGFKSSGKIGTIEDGELQNDIMDLYEEDVPSLLASTKIYVTLKLKFFDLIFKNLKRTSDSTTNMISFLRSDETNILSSYLGAPIQVISRYDICIQKMNKIIAEIDKEYGP
jgi:hypothetical protein